MNKNSTLETYDKESDPLYQELKKELIVNLAPGETLSEEVLQECWDIHNELNGMAHQMADAFVDRFSQWMQKNIGPVTPEHLEELLNQEICLLVQSGFLHPDLCTIICKERELARQELSEMHVVADEQTVARYALLRKLVVKMNGRFMLKKGRGALYVHNNLKYLTQIAKEDFVRFGYMLKLINEKLTELDKKQVEEVIEYMADLEDTLPPASVDEEPSIIKSQEQYEERFLFIHPEIEDEEAWRIHESVKRLVATQKIPEICVFLKELKKKGKVLLPSTPAVMYKELVRMGMPTSDGYSEKYFRNSYIK